MLEKEVVASSCNLFFQKHIQRISSCSPEGGGSKEGSFQKRRWLQNCVIFMSETYPKDIQFQPRGWMF